MPQSCTHPGRSDSEFCPLAPCAAVPSEPTTIKLPFGGLGHSGNLRPAAAFSVDYCAHAVANMVEASPDVAIPTGMHWDDAWL